jgi:TonB-dependent SusC/RagA subfamily outer membrane receptor
MRALDPKRIESVEVLKGAAAARTYGDEAQWGVITVRTRSGPPPR